MIHLGDITKINGAEVPPVDVVTGGYRVYKYTFPDGKVYIGMTKNSIATRKHQGYQHNKKLQEAIRSVGFRKVVITILADGLSQNEAFELEKHYIEYYHSCDTDKGFNVSKGGKSTFSGLHHSEEHKEHMRELFKGKTFTTEHIEHLRESHNVQKKPVVRLMPDGKEIHYDSVGAAAADIKGHKSNISRACQSGKMYKGNVWFYAERGDVR